jgi:hypothetical protein
MNTTAGPVVRKGMVEMAALDLQEAQMVKEARET